MENKKPPKRFTDAVKKLATSYHDGITNLI